jgi:hypothetical protein
MTYINKNVEKIDKSELDIDESTLTFVGNQLSVIGGASNAVQKTGNNIVTDMTITNDLGEGMGFNVGEEIFWGLTRSVTNSAVPKQSFKQVVYYKGHTYCLSSNINSIGAVYQVTASNAFIDIPINTPTNGIQELIVNDDMMIGLNTNCNVIYKYNDTTKSFDSINISIFPTTRPVKGCFGNGYFIFGQFDSLDTLFLYKTSDFITWTTFQTTTLANSNVIGASFVNNTFLFTMLKNTGLNRVVIIGDGNSFSGVSTNIQIGLSGFLVSNGDTFIAVDPDVSGSVVYTSTDGATWVVDKVIQKNLTAGTALGKELYFLATDNSLSIKNNTGDYTYRIGLITSTAIARCGGSVFYISNQLFTNNSYASLSVYAAPVGCDGTALVTIKQLVNEGVITLPPQV